MNYFTERDWKLFRAKLPKWQENYMDRLNKEYKEILNSDKLPSEKFWELEKRIFNDKKHVGVTAVMSRSRFLDNIFCFMKRQLFLKIYLILVMN